MSRKAKGSNAERELVHMFWSKEWAAIRVAGSGSNKYPSPDVLAGNAIRRLAIEVKSTKETSKYLTKDQVDELKEFAKMFGAEPWIGVRFSQKRWFFFNIEDLRETKQSLTISLDECENKGLSFDELLG